MPGRPEMPEEPGRHEVPGMPGNQGYHGHSGMMPDYRRTLACVMPAVKEGLKEVQAVGVKHAVTEAALTAYLMGMGYPYQHAIRLVESWERNETFPM